MNNELIIKEVIKYEFWNNLTLEEQKNWILNTKSEKYNKNEIIYNTENKCKGIIKVIKGTLKVYMISEEGREITLYKIKEGEICTLSAACMMEEVGFDIYIKSTEETDAITTNTACIRKIKDENINFENYLYKELASKFTEVMWNIEEHLFTSLDKRLALFLLKEEKDKMVVFTHQEIAEELGSSREVISRLLKKLENERLIDLLRGKIKILDKIKLKNKI